MRVAVTGGTGFIGRYIVEHLVGQDHHCRCWYRATSDRTGYEQLGDQVEWISGELAGGTERSYVEDCDAVVHAALDRPGDTFRGGEGDLVEFIQNNVVGTIQLIEAARTAGVSRFVFISTCAVHETILADRPLDEAHPLWPSSHYGAHKAAIEKFVHSYGLGVGYTICALRPTGVYGVARPVERSKWFPLVQAIVQGEEVACQRGGKEVHAADVAKAVGILLSAEAVAGQAYNCYDQYVSEYDVATLAKKISGSQSQIAGGQTRPKHEIVADKLRALGMEFGGGVLLEKTIGQLVDAAS